MSSMFERTRAHETWIAVFVGSLVILLNVAYWAQAYSGQLSERTVFTAIFLNVVFLVVLCLPWFERHLGDRGEECLKKFLQLPDEDAHLTFPVLSNFLSEQALGAFLGSVLIYTGKDVLLTSGVTLSAIYVALFYVLAMAYVSLSCTRFLLLFASRHWFSYGAAAAFSLLVTFSFFSLGLKFAPVSGG